MLVCLFLVFHLFVSLPLVWGVQPVLVLQLDWSSFVPWSEKHKYVIALVYCPLTLRYLVLHTDIEIQMCHCYCAVHWHWDTKTLLLCLMTLRHWNTDVSLLLCSRLTLRHWRALLCPVTLKTGSWWHAFLYWWPWQWQWYWFYCSSWWIIHGCELMMAFYTSTYVFLHETENINECKQKTVGTMVSYQWLLLYSVAAWSKMPKMRKMHDSR